MDEWKALAAGKLAADDEDVRVILAAMEQRAVLVAPDMKPQAWGVSRTSTRPMLNRVLLCPRMYEHQH